MGDNQLEVPMHILTQVHEIPEIADATRCERTSEYNARSHD